ncbi:MAG: protein-glutamate O-methyltransferase [Thermodesulfobacteriota bacterium]
MGHISDRQFNELVELVYRESGIVLKDKRELVEARLASLSRRKGYQEPAEVIESLKQDQGGAALVELLDQVSTNLTYFYREPAHFEFLEKVLLPELVNRKRAARRNRIRFWSAACSSGEEAYSLAMTTKEHLPDGGNWDFKILATDISTKVLRKAVAGRYTRPEVLKAPAGYIQKYFDRSGDRHEPVYEVRREIKDLVVFRRLNLLMDSYPFSGLFDLIVCRNVMIYFDQPTKQALLSRFFRYLEPSGYFFTGHAESLTGYEHLFRRVRVAVYRK